MPWAVGHHRGSSNSAQCRPATNKIISTSFHCIPSRTRNRSPWQTRSAIPTHVRASPRYGLTGPVSPLRTRERSPQRPKTSRKSTAARRETRDRDRRPGAPLGGSCRFWCLAWPFWEGLLTPTNTPIAQLQLTSETYIRTMRVCDAEAASPGPGSPGLPAARRSNRNLLIPLGLI